jgi:predicted metalloprotease with PDZ domain
VTEVPRGTPAHTAGLNVDDEVLGLNEFRVRADAWQRRLEHFQPGETVSLLVARRERFLRLDVRLAAAPPTGWRLELHPAASPAQHARLLHWLGD